MSDLKRIATRVLEQQAECEREFDKLEKAGVYIEMNRLVPDYAEAFADEFGVPEDTPTDAGTYDYLYANDGAFPPGCYCRDWLHNFWFDVVAGKKTVPEFVAELEQAAAEAKVESNG